MASQPSETNISQFMVVTELDRATAINYLRGTSDDLWRAIDMAINGEPPTQPSQATVGWNEGDWGKDRNGDYSQENIPSFQIDVADDMPSYSQSVAPSRPPTRNSQRSTNSGINKINSGSASGRVSRMDVERPSQETGVVTDGTSAPHFGPATRSHYDANDWALTVSAATIGDSYADPPPSLRKREPGQVAFLKPSLSKDYLPSLLTILNSIPLAHNALLLGSYAAHDYGYDSEWWSGASIKSVSETTPHESTVSRLDEELIQETQRLMAFLDMTERSYGSVEALNNLKALTDISTSGLTTQLDLETDFEKFLAAWQTALSNILPNSEIANVLASTATVNDQQHKFPVFPATLGENMAFKPRSLYDVLDAKLFIEEWPNVDDDIAAITEPAKVFIFKLKQADMACEGLDLDVPAVWYADRYLKDCLDLTRVIRRDVAHSKAFIQLCEEQEQELSKYDCNGKVIDPLQLLRVSMKAFRLRTTEEKEAFPRDVVKEAEEEARYNEVLNKIQKTLDRAREKLDDLKLQKERTIAQLRRHSYLLTEPTGNPETTPKFRYQLCGVATKPNTTYVRQPFTVVGTRDGQSTEYGQWWKIECSFQDASYLECLPKKTTESEVLDAAKRDSKEVMLVYASDEALAVKLDSLPPALVSFVRRDNRAFEQEIEREESYSNTISRGNGTSDDASAWAAQPSAPWDDSQSSMQPPSFDWTERWARGTYTYDKPKDNTAEHIHSAGSSNESGQITLTPDTEMTETEMKEREATSLVAEMMSDNRTTSSDSRKARDVEMVDMSTDSLDSGRAATGDGNARHIENIGMNK